MEIHLRPLLPADWPAVQSWAGREESCRYQSWGPNTPAQTQEFVEVTAAAWSQNPQTKYPYAAVLDGQVQGMGTLHVHSSAEGEISYGVHPDLWGQGIGTKIGQELLRIGFTTHKLHRIFGTCDPRNTGSARVLTNLGMTYEGRKRETQLIRDGWRDSDLYSILEHEWPGR
jgi:ribosomal-protein-alanine N-acetyltransferase